MQKRQAMWRRMNSDKSSLGRTQGIWEKIEEKLKSLQSY